MSTVSPDPRRIELLLERCRLEVSDGTLPSVQVAVHHNGREYAYETFGDATPSTRYVLQSAGRSIVAGVIWKLISDEVLDITRTVASYLPEFGTNGKDVVTVEHVLTHVAGFPLAPLGYPQMLDREQRLVAFAKWRLVYPPGAELQYHLTSAAWVLGELCERLTGASIGDYLRDVLAGPLGLDSIEIGPPVERQGDVALFVRIDTDTETEPNPWGPWYLSRAEILAAGEPSHSLVATARDLAGWYQALMASPLWRREVVADATRVRVNLPVSGERGGTASVPASQALFVSVAGNDGLSRAFLPITGSPRVFGHGGAPCQIGFADPDTGLSVAFLTNGYPTTGYEQSRVGRNRITNIANLAADLFSASPHANGEGR